MEFLAGTRPGFSIGSLYITWYGFIMACSMALGVVLCYFFAKRRGLKSLELVTVALYTLPCAVIGARVFYVIFNPNGITYTFVEALQLWKGGMSIWGGIIGGVIGVALCCWIHKKDFISVCDVIAPALILAQATGRWGNFINQEAHGWEVTNPKFFGLPFTVEIGGHYFLATFLFEAILNTLGFIVLVNLLHFSKKRGLVLSVYLMWYGIVRSVIEIFRTDPMMIGSVKFSQMMSIIAACIGAVLFIYIFIRDALKKKKGIDPYEYLHLRQIANKMIFKDNIINVSLQEDRTAKIYKNKKKVIDEKIKSAKANRQPNTYTAKEMEDFIKQKKN